jgi:transposase-like protein
MYNEWSHHTGETEVAPLLLQLVMIGALTNGKKVILAVESGQRESKESRGMMLRDLRKRGLKP